MTQPASPASPLSTAQMEVTHKRVLSIALPIVLSNATVPILGAVDTAVVGQMGMAAPIGAVGIGAVILASIYWIFGFLRMGTTGLVAQASGAGEGAEVSRLLTRALFVAGAGGLLVIIAQVPLMWGAFKLASASPQVESLARDYIGIRIWSAPFAISVFGLTGWLIAQERTQSVLIIQLWMNGLNMLLDFVFVLGFGWGVQGVAFATVLAEVSGAGLGLWLCRGAFAGEAWREWARVFERQRLIHMAKLNTDIMLRSALLMGVIVSFAFIGAGFGDVTLAANHILMQFIEITAFALDGLAFAAEAVVGQAVGARRRDVLRRGAILCAGWSAGFAVLLALTFGLFGGAIIDVMTTAPDVRAQARLGLVWMIGVPIVGFGSWVLDGIFIGATRSRDMRNMMFVSVAIYALACVLLIPIWGNNGLWLALLISYGVRGLTLLARYPALERSVEAPASRL